MVLRCHAPRNAENAKDMKPTVKPQQSSTVLDSLENLFSRFLALSPGLALVLALWSLATHLHDVFDAFAYLAITSPTKRCGKTRLCELLGLVCFQPLHTVSISPAALYRLLRAGKRTLIIDEAEYLAGRKDERASALREILNAGYRKGQVVYRCKNTGKVKGNNGQSFEPEAFETYCPKVLVLIGRLQDTLADRCIEVRMQRIANVILERFRYDRVKAETAKLRKQVAEWAKRNAVQVEGYYLGSDLPFVRDREAELWLPLFAVCAVAAPHRLPELEAVAKRLADAKEDHDTGDLGIQLLNDIRDAFTESESDSLPTRVLLKMLNSRDESPWAGWSGGMGLNSHALSRLLDPFEISSRNVRYEGRVPKGYKRRSFADAWARYLRP